MPRPGSLADLDGPVVSRPAGPVRRSGVGQRLPVSSRAGARSRVAAAEVLLAMTRCRLEEPVAVEELAGLVARLEREQARAGPTHGVLGEVRHLLAGR
jgi:hypothetical protein